MSPSLQPNLDLLGQNCALCHHYIGAITYAFNVHFELHILVIVHVALYLQCANMALLKAMKVIPIIYKMPNSRQV